MARCALLAASLIAPFLAFCGYAFLNGFLATRGRELATEIFFCPKPGVSLKSVNLCFSSHRSNATVPHLYGPCVNAGLFTTRRLQGRIPGMDKHLTKIVQLQ